MVAPDRVARPQNLQQVCADTNEVQGGEDTWIARRRRYGACRSHGGTSFTPCLESGIQKLKAFAVQLIAFRSFRVRLYSDGG